MARKTWINEKGEKMVSMTSEDIKNRKWTKKEIATLNRIAKPQAAGGRRVRVS
jgi:hypothetical protein